jgi:hypothetical protein
MSIATNRLGRREPGQPFQFRQRVVERIDLGFAEFPAGRFIPVRFPGDLGIGEVQRASPVPPVVPRGNGVAAHGPQDPAEADAPAPPNPPRDADPADEELPTPLTPVDAWDVDDHPPDPDDPGGHAVASPVTGSLQRLGNTTAVVMTPPPSRTKAIAEDDLMARA